MDSKIRSLKTSCKVVSILMEIGYIAMIVLMCICAAQLIFMAVTSGELSVTTGGVTFAVTDELSALPEDLTVFCAEYLVVGAFLFSIFLLAHRMFREISRTGDPFAARYSNIIRAIGILVAAGGFAADGIVSLLGIFIAGAESTVGVDMSGIVVGAVIFCLSYIVEYGCALKANPTESISKTAQ